MYPELNYCKIFVSFTLNAAYLLVTIIPSLVIVYTFHSCLSKAIAITCAADIFFFFSKKGEEHVKTHHKYTSCKKKGVTHPPFTASNLPEDKPFPFEKQTNMALEL